MSSRLSLGAVVALVMALWLGSGCAVFKGGGNEWGAWHPRPEHYGRSLPYPIKLPRYRADTAAFRAEAEREISLMLSIDAAGQVTGIDADDATDSPTVNAYSEYLQAIKFEPGLIDSVKVDMELPLVLQVGAIGSRPVLSFPVAPHRAVVGTDLYWRAMAQNGIERPTIKRFPAYRYVAGKETSPWECEYKVYRLDLDETGYPTLIELISNNSSSGNDEMASVINWGDYTPLRIDGRPVATTAYVALAFFRQLVYPVKALEFDDDSLTAWDILRVQLVPDTLGLMLPPIPGFDWSGKIPNQNWEKKFEGLFSARQLVDSLGFSKVSELSDGPWQTVAILHDRAFMNRFYPALDFSGRPQPFSGLIWMDYLDQANVRIRFSWSPAGPY